MLIFCTNAIIIKTNEHKAVDEEKPEHFDLFLLIKNEKNNALYIRHFSTLMIFTYNIIFFILSNDFALFSS